MAYKIIPTIEGYGVRKGLEGPLQDIATEQRITWADANEKFKGIML